MSTHIDYRRINTEAEARDCFPVMQELRPHLSDAADFARQVTRQAEQGYRLLAAYQDGLLAGLAGYRLTENLIYGRFVYVDDLVITASLQRAGIGAGLLDAVRREAVALRCRHFVLDTGLHMAHAQRFYFRQGLLARGMHFALPLDGEEGA